LDPNPVLVFNHYFALIENVFSIVSADGTDLPADQKTPFTITRRAFWFAKSLACPSDVVKIRFPYEFFHVHAIGADMV
jgi:hypothetical protein